MLFFFAFPLFEWAEIIQNVVAHLFQIFDHTSSGIFFF
jgi:hypothetical protein